MNKLIRKQGRCYCEECKKSWEYDFKEPDNMETLDLGYTEGHTIYVKCSEHIKDLGVGDG